VTARARKSVGVPASLARPVDRGPACRAEVEAEEAFAEFERSMIQQRVRAGLKVVRDKLARDGKFETRRGVIRTKLGRPGAERRWRFSGSAPGRPSIGIGKIAQELGLGAGTVHRIKRQMLAS